MLIAVLLEPKQSGEIIWKFSTSVELEVACNIPGHYEAGMIAKIVKIFNKWKIYQIKMYTLRRRYITI